MAGRQPAKDRASSPPEVRAILEWQDARRQDYPDAPFWSEFARALNADLMYALKMLQAAVSRKPSQLLEPPRAGGRQSAERLRVLSTIAYLKGDWTPPGLAPIGTPLTPESIAELAGTLAGPAGDGQDWAVFMDSRRGAFLYERAKTAGMHVPVFGPARIGDELKPLLRSLISATGFPGNRVRDGIGGGA